MKKLCQTSQTKESVKYGIKIITHKFRWAAKVVVDFSVKFANAAHDEDIFKIFPVSRLEWKAPSKFKNYEHIMSQLSCQEL